MQPVQASPDGARAEQTEPGTLDCRTVGIFDNLEQAWIVPSSFHFRVHGTRPWPTLADDSTYDPEVALQRQIEERRQAYEQLMRKLGPLRRVLLRRVYRLIDLFAGARDTPKHLMVLFNYAIRRRALVEGRRLQQAGRLYAAEDVFDLTFGDLAAASRDITLDLRLISQKRSRFQRKLKAHVTMFPAVIDSRGRVLRPPARTDEPRLLCGMPVSAGVVTGPVKVLDSPHEKRVEKGDVKTTCVGSFR